MATLEEQYAQRQAEAQNIYDTRQAENQSLYDQRMTAANQTYDQRQAAAQATYDQRQQAAQNTYAERQAEAQKTYEQRSAEAQGKINSLYDNAFAAQKQQFQTALDQGIAAQEEARANIAKSYQTSANDLAVQYERNRRNLNAQALARGLNTGTGSQQQLAVNQAYMKSYGQLRGEESAQNAGIDRAIANLKIDYENNIAQALADNDYKRAAALMDDYNNQLAWLDNQKATNQNYLDTMSLNNQNRLDTQGDQNRSYLDTQTANNQNRLDSFTLNNQNRYDTSSDNNRNWLDTQTRYEQQQAEAKAQTLASYGDFSGYAAIYGQEQASAMREMWIAQNPLLAYNTGAITAERYRQMTGENPPGYEDNSGGGGGGGGYYYGPSEPQTEGEHHDRLSNKNSGNVGAITSTGSKLGNIAANVSANNLPTSANNIARYGKS